MSRFDDFWAAYPRKVGKLAARREWDRQQGDAKLHLMLEAIAEQRQSAQWQDPQFIPHPRTWLHQGRWADEVPVPMTPHRVRYPDSHLCRHDPRCTSDRMHANALAMGRDG